MDENAAAEAAADLGITSTARSLGRKTDADGWEHDAWTVTLKYQGRSQSFPYRMGTGHHGAKPETGDVLYALLSDADVGDMSFEDFVSDFGLDEDSRKAEQTWKSCKATKRKLERLLGGSYRELYEHPAMGREF